MDTPDRVDVEVVETRIVRIFDPKKKAFVEVGTAEDRVTVALGMRRADGSFGTPDEMPVGVYQIGFNVAVQDRKGVRRQVAESMTFEVTKDRAKLLHAEQEARRVEQEGQRAESETPRIAQAAPRGGAKAVEHRMLRIISDNPYVRKQPSRMAPTAGRVTKGEVYPEFEEKTERGEKWYRIELDDGKSVWLLSNHASREQ